MQWGQEGAPQAQSKDRADEMREVAVSGESELRFHPEWSSKSQEGCREMDHDLICLKGHSGDDKNIEKVL